MASKLMSLVQIGNQLVTSDGIIIDGAGFYSQPPRNDVPIGSPDRGYTSSSDIGNRIYMIYKTLCDL